MARFTEKSALENYLIEKLSSPSMGWKFVLAGDLEREGFEEPLLLKNLIRKIKELNSIELTDDDISTVIKSLKLKSATSQEGCRAILTYLKDGISIKLEKERVLEKIKLFDFDDVSKNEFIVTRQAHYVNGDARSILDIVLYVNGIPLVNIECKNPASLTEDWTSAFNDIQAYETQVPELYKYVQIGIVAAEVARYFPIVPWTHELTDIKTEEWKAEGVTDSIDAMLQMLSKDVLLDLIKNFIFFRIKMGGATKVIARYMQYRAVNKIVKRVIDGVGGIESKKRGLTWHWQGSGKTFEMVFAANKLYQNRKLENPTIFLIVDRVDLEDQLTQEFNSLDVTKPEVVDSIEKLKEIVEHDNYRGRRGLVLTLVHKFRPDELAKVEQEIRVLSKSQETLSTRKNVIAFIDEGHRTQSGQLAAQMKSILGEKTAYFFAFTGTPISKPERGIDTYGEFSYPDQGEKYLDKYFITESWQDGFTVRIAYQPALAEKEGIHLKKDLLDEFLRQKYQEIPDNIRAEVEEGIREKLSIIKAYLENPDRIKMIAAHIASNYKNNIDGKFKAMVVAVSREACVAYKRELDKLLPPEYSEIVMSYSDKHDSDTIKAFRKELIERYNGKDTDDIKKEVIGNFKEEEFPKILIVKDMLLTGFDAPILQTIYLDQPLKEHRLLQAIARTNRPYKNIKEVGLIIDYIGILKDFHRAFEIYTKEEIKDVLYSLPELRKEFAERLAAIMKLFEGVSKDKGDRATLLKAIEILTSDEQIGAQFVQSYKTLRRLFELLGADIIKAELASEYGWVSQVYAVYVKTVLTRTDEEKLYIEQYFKKTVELIHKSTDLKALEDTLPMIEFNERYLDVLEAKVKSKEEKAANLVFTLNRYVLVDRQRNAIYETVSSRVEKLLEMWKQKTRNFEEIYKEGLAIWKQLMSIKARQHDLGLDDAPYNFLLIFEDAFGKKDALLNDAKELYDLLDEQIGLKKRKFPNWALQLTVRKSVEKIIRTYIRKYVREDGLTLDKMEKLYQRLIDYVVKYG